jgi:Fibronectin type III domain/Divergent InlB B-repeat domain
VEFGHRLNKRTVLLICLTLITVIFLSASFVFPYSVTLSWNAPTKNADGTPLTDLAGYKVYYRNSSGGFSQSINVGNVTTRTVSNLTDGIDYYFAVTAYDTSGNESGYSNEVSAQQNILTVTKGGTGTGTVASSPGGIVCGSDCSEAYKSGTVVTLTPVASTGSTFTGWSGGGCSGNAPQCSLTISSSAVVAANFSSLTPLTQTETIIDNRDSATSKTGSWYKSSGSDSYESDSVFSRNGSTFTWYFTPSRSGSYEVSSWWTYRDSRSTSIPVDINYSGGKVRVYVNQKKDGGKWNLLGKYNFKRGITYHITIISQPYPTSTCADAVKFTLVQ